MIGVQVLDATRHQYCLHLDSIFELCAAPQVLGLKSVHIIYIESIARVDHLSLTGKILYHLRLSNLFLVQWEKLADKLPRAKFISRLM